MFVGQVKVNSNASLNRIFADIHGVGVKHQKYFWTRLGVSRHSYLTDIPKTNRDAFEKLIKGEYFVGPPYRKFSYQYFVKPHLTMGSYKGIRMRQGLPANGQRTHSNASTARRLIRTKLKK